jgi:hypothetical protein
MGTVAVKEAGGYIDEVEAKTGGCLLPVIMVAEAAGGTTESVSELVTVNGNLIIN